MTMSLLARAPRFRLRRLAAATATTVATVAIALMLVAPASALAATPADAASGPPAERPITFTMAPSANGVVSANAPLTVTVAAGNPTASTIAAGAVQVTTSTTPLANRGEVTAWLSTAPGGSARTNLAVGSGEIAGIAARGESSVTLPIDGTALSLLTPGVYPLRADYTSAQGSLSAVSVLVVRGDAGTGALGVVVPITAPPLATGLLSPAQLTTLTGPGGALRERLDAVTGTAAILAVDPAIVAAIRVLGTSAPPAALQWLDDLIALPNTRFALQFGDAELSVQVAAGVGAPLSMRSLAPYVSPADFTAVPTATDAAAPPTPTPTAAPGDASSAVPSLAALTDIGSAARNVFWPATGTAGSEVVAALGELTVDEVASVTLVDSGALAGSAAAHAPPPARAAADGDRVLVYDAEASIALHDAATAERPVTRDRALAAASAYAAMSTSAAPTEPLLVAIDRADSYSSTGLRAAVTAAASLGGRTASGLETITAGTPTTVTLDSVPVAPEQIGALTTLLDDEVALTSFATILADPAVLSAPERAAMLQLIGNGWRALPGPAADAFDAHRRQTANTLDSVAIVPPSDITLAATSAPLGFSVRNDLAWPVSLVLIATPNDPRLIVQNTTPVEAGAAQNTRVKVPVEARVGSGESNLHLQLRSPVMVAVGPSVPVHVAVRAEWESVGLIVMVTLVAAMIVLGIIRTVRRVRRGRRAPVPAADTPADAKTVPELGGTDG